MYHGLTIRRLAACVLALAGAFSLTSGRCEAGLTLSLEPTTAAAGGSGAFDVLLTVTGDDVDVSGFSFGLTVASGSGIAFTGATDATETVSYIFTTPEMFDATVGSPATTLIASDSLFSIPFATLKDGDVVGLGRVSYAVAAGTAAGDVTASFLLDNLETDVFDANGGSIAFDATPGTIRATANQPVPEPASLALLGLAVAPVVLAARRRSA